MSKIIKPYTKRYFKCPCGDNGEEFSIEHLYGESRGAGPWYCRTCGVGWKIKIIDGNDVELIDSGYKSNKCLDIMKLDPKKMKGKPLYLLVDGSTLKEEGVIDKPVVLSSKDYFYNEHTCPTNWLR
jgi:hypothetical protein